MLFADKYLGWCGGGGLAPDLVGVGISGPGGDLLTRFADKCPFGRGCAFLAPAMVGWGQDGDFKQRGGL